MAILENGTAVEAEGKKKAERISFYFPRSRIIFETPERQSVKDGKVKTLPARRFLRLSADGAERTLGVWLTSTWITSTDRVGANVVVTVSKDGYEYPLYQENADERKWEIVSMMTGAEIAELVSHGKIGEVCDNPETKSTWESREDFFARTGK